MTTITEAVVEAPNRAPGTLAARLDVLPPVGVRKFRNQVGPSYE